MNDTNALSDICLCGSSHADDPDRALAHRRVFAPDRPRLRAFRRAFRRYRPYIALGILAVAIVVMNVIWIGRVLSRYLSMY